MPTDCEQELCPNWGGDGRACPALPCAALGLEPPSADPYGESYDRREKEDNHGNHV